MSSSLFQIHLLGTLDLFGTAVFAASGALMAREQRRNKSYAVLYAILTALGGGTIRDCLLAQPSIFWMRSPIYLWIAIAAGLLTFALTAVMRVNRRAFRFADTLSLATFSVVGVRVAIASSAFVPTSFLHYAILPFIGLTTAVGGGIIRDVLGQTEPYVLQAPYYAIASLASGSMYGLLVGLQAPALIALSVAIAIAFLFLSRSPQPVFSQLSAYQGSQSRSQSRLRTQFF